jgi:hypothetical protein
MSPAGESLIFTDDLRGLPRAGQIARVQAEARANDDDLDEAQAARVLDLYTFWPHGVTDPEPADAIPRAVAAEARELARQRKAVQIADAPSALL